MHNVGIENTIISFIERSINSVIKDLRKTAIPAHELSVELEIPKEKSHGDLATNVAMRASKLAGVPPMELAGLMAVKMKADLERSRLKDTIQNVEAKAPGFINFFFSRNYLYKALLEIERKKDSFGRSSTGRGIRLQVEFVSANPTGPLTIAHGRQAAIGDAVANILEFVGYDVTREYYLNDEGNQINMLGQSLKCRYRELFGIPAELPADGYKGAYVVEIARDFKKKYGKKRLATEETDVFREFALNWILRDIKDDLRSFGVTFDVWYSQRALRKSGKINKALSLLKEKGYIFEHENAVWFKSTAFGDDKDRVVVKSDSSYTYLAPDIAYHLDKYRRGFKRIIDIWGPDHHGYIPRMRAAVQALGYGKDSLSVLIVQLATLLRSGQAVSMSTRAGEFITLREVRDEVGKDVARFCFLMRKISSHLDFDIDVVKTQSMDNPVYYIQYAHARIWSIFEHSRKMRLSSRFDSHLLKEEEEIDLIRILRQFPMIVVLSAKSLEPYVVLQYLQSLAGAFHSFYTKHRVVGDDPHLTRARLVLVNCVRIVLANGLRLLGVSLPKKM